MKVGQVRTHLEALSPDSDSQPSNEPPATSLDAMDSPHGYTYRPRKPRGARKHDIQAPKPKRSGGLRATLLAQAQAGKHDSAEIYRQMFGPPAEADKEPPQGWLRGADFDVDTLIKMSSVDFDRVDFSSPEQRGDLSDGCETSSDAPDVSARAKSSRAQGAGDGDPSGADDADACDYFEYVPRATLRTPPRLSSRGAACLARMTDEELGKVDVIDYFETPSRRRSIEAPATSAANS